MTRRHLAPAALLVAAALAAPSAAQAKQVTGLTVCGADGCSKVDRAIGQAMHDLGGPGIATAPRPAPHFRLVVRVGDGKRTFGTSRVVYVPASRAIGNDSGWSRLSPGPAAKLGRVLDGRAPLPAAQLATATKTASGGGSDVVWWSLGGLGALTALAFIGNSQVRRR